MDFEIKKATIDNLKDIQRLNHELCKKEHDEFDPSIIPDWSLSKEAEEYFKERISNGCALIATKGNKIIGYLVGSLIERDTYRKVEKIAELENMLILKEYRSSGVGTRIHQTFIDWCKKKGVQKVKVEVTSQKTKAINFYRKNKFTDYRVTLEKDL